MIPLSVTMPDTSLGVRIIIDDKPSYTGFSNPDGLLIGLEGESYDPQVVSLQEGYLSVLPAPIGDANSDGMLNIGDVVFLSNYVYNSGPAPLPIESGNVNCDDGCNVGDIVYMINYIFKNGPKPCAAK